MVKNGIRSIKPINISKLQPKFKDYTTTTGLHVRLKAMPLKLIDKSNASVIDPEIPKYTMEVLGGDVQEDILTEDVVKSFEVSDPEIGKKYREIYTNYMIALDKASDTRREKFIKILLLRGIDFDIPDEDAWLEEMNELDIEIPENKLKRKLFYLDTEVMANPRDMSAIFDGVMSISGVPSEALADARDSFRNLLADEEREEDPTGETTE
jgi:hypothetical protein